MLLRMRLTPGVCLIVDKKWKAAQCDSPLSKLEMERTFKEQIKKKKTEREREDI